MEQLVNTLISLSKQSRLVPAEQIITSSLLDFEKIVPAKLAEKNFLNIEAPLIALLSINGGTISFQCSVRIAKCLLYIFKSHNPPKIWNFVTAVTSKPNPANIYAFGYVIDKIGLSVRSMIPGVVKKIISNTSGVNLLPTIYAVSHSFKRDRADLADLSKKALNLAYAGLNSNDESYQLASVKLFRSLLKQKDMNTKRFMQIANDISNAAVSNFVIDELCYFIANIAYLPFSHFQNNTQVIENDFAVGKPEEENKFEPLFDGAFAIMSEIKPCFDGAIRHFLDLVDPQLVSTNLIYIFKLLRKIGKKEIPQVLAFTGSDSRIELFSHISKESPTPDQFYLLRGIRETPDVSAAALQLCASPNPEYRATGASYFKFLSENYPEEAMQYLNTASLYLAHPPEDNDNLRFDLRGFAIITSNILGGMPQEDRDLHANKIATNLQQLFNRGLSMKNVFAPSFSGSFTVLRQLPKYLIPVDLIQPATNVYINYVKKLPQGCEGQYQELLDIGTSIALFYSNHPTIPGGPEFFLFLMNTRPLLSRTTVLASLLATPDILYGKNALITVASQILEQLATIHPEPECAKAPIKYSMPGIRELLVRNFYVSHRNRLKPTDLSDSYFADKAFNAFPTFILAIPNHSVQTVLNSLVNSTTNLLMMRFLLLSICQNHETCSLLSSSWLQQFIKGMTSLQDEATQQITAECIGAWLSNKMDYYNNIIAYANDAGEKNKCFIYSAIFGNVQLNESHLFTMMNEMATMANLKGVTPYALHALYVMCDVYPSELASLQVTDILLDILLKLLNTPYALNPFSLYYMNKLFVSLLHLAAPDMAKKKIIPPQIRLILQAFLQLQLPFARQIMYQTMSAAFAFMKELLPNNEMFYPTKRGASMMLRLSACSALSDMLEHGQSTQTDFFPIVPRVLFLLQRSKDERAAIFVKSIAALFSKSQFPSSPTVRARITEWINLVKTVLATSTIPSTEIEANEEVKHCALEIATQLVPLLASSSPLLNECLDDLMTSITRSIETKRERLMDGSFSLLLKVLEHFKDVEADGGDKLLMLYDSQFSIAVRFSFKTSFEFSGPMLIEYLSFLLANLKNRTDELKVILESYLNGITSCKKSSPFYIQLASNLCNLANSNKLVLDILNPVFQDMAISFCEVISISMALWRSSPPDWDQISEFRKKYSRFYSQMVCSFIRLQVTLNLPLLDYQVLIDFFVDELKKGNEIWRITGSLEILGTIFNMYKDKVKQEEIDKIINLATELSKTNEKLSTGALPTFLQSCATAVGTSDQLLEFTLNSRFDLHQFVNLLRDSKKDSIESKLPKFSDKIIQAYTDNLINDNQCIALFTIMLDLSTYISKSLLKVFTLDKLSPVRFELIYRALRRLVNENIDLTSISATTWKHYNEGGMLMISNLILKNPTAGLKIFTSDKLKKLREICIEDAQTVIANIQLTIIAFSIHKRLQLSDPDFEINCANLALDTIISWGNDIQRGTEIVSTAINLLDVIQQEESKAIKAAFAQIEKAEKAKCVDIIDKQISKLETRRKVQQLKTFSNTQRKVQDMFDNDDDDDEGWQTF